MPWKPADGIGMGLARGVSLFCLGAYRTGSNNRSS